MLRRAIVHRGANRPSLYIYILRRRRPPVAAQPARERIGSRWRISLASVVANVATALLLVIVGIVWYREHLAGRQVVGLLMCLGGLLLAARP
jgi:hypothetical protein